MTSFYLYSHAAYFQRQYRTVGVVEVRHNIIAMYFCREQFAKPILFMQLFLVISTVNVSIFLSFSMLYLNALFQTWFNDHGFVSQFLFPLFSLVSKYL